MNCCTAPKCFIASTQRSEKRTALCQRLRQDHNQSLLEEHVNKMRTLSTKALLGVAAAALQKYTLRALERWPLARLLGLKARS